MLLWLCWCWSDYTWEDQEVVWGVYENCLLIIYCLQGRSCFGLIMPLPPRLRLFSSSKNWHLPILLGCLWNIDSSGLAPEKYDLRGLGWGRKCVLWQEPAKSSWSGNLENTTPGGEVTLPFIRVQGSVFQSNLQQGPKGFEKVDQVRLWSRCPVPLQTVVWRGFLYRTGFQFPGATARGPVLQQHNVFLSSPFWTYRLPNGLNSVRSPGAFSLYLPKHLDTSRWTVSHAQGQGCHD